MALLDWFKSRPLWQHPDPLQRVAGVRQLPPEDQEALTSIARTDPDPRVRRAALHRVRDGLVLAELARNDAEASVREEACELLLRVAIEKDDPAAEQALEALSDQKHLVAASREARSAVVRQGAVARLREPRALATVAKTSEHAAIRTAALERLDDPTLLADVALRAEAKDVAVAALERVIDDRDVLSAVAARAKSKAAARRAQAALEEIARRESEEAERERAAAVAAAADAAAARVAASQAEAVAAAAERERTRREHLGAREVLVARVDDLEGDDALVHLTEAEAAWAALPAWNDPEAKTWSERFEAAAARCRDRYGRRAEREALRAKLQPLCDAVEALSGEDLTPATREKIGSLRKEWVTAAGDAPADLRTRFETALAKLAERDAELRASREDEAKTNLMRLLDLCVRLETFAAADKPPLAEAGRAFRESKEVLDHLPRLPSKHDQDQVAVRLKAARAALFPKLQELREADEWTRWANVAIQEQLCARVEGLAGRDDLAAVAKELEDIQARWKEARQVPKDKAEGLWQRFKAAHDPVKARLDAHFAQHKAEQAENQKKKEALCEAAESLRESTEWAKTAAELQRLQAEWKGLGPGPRRQDADVSQRFRRACQHFFERRKADLDRRKQEWARNLEKKEGLIGRAEALKDSTAWDEVLAEIKRLQAEWKTVGQVKKSHSDAVWQRFRSACDTAFERYRRRGELDAQSQTAQREALLVEMEGLVSSVGHVPNEDLAGKVQSLLASWRSLPELSRGRGTDLDVRFLAARDQIVALAPAAFAGSDLDPEANRVKLEKLVAKVESLIPAEVPVGVGGSPNEELASRIKEALAANTMGGRASEAAKWQAASRDVEAAQAAIRRVGPAGEPGAALRRRFDEACRRFSDARRQSGH